MRACVCVCVLEGEAEILWTRSLQLLKWWAPPERGALCEVSLGSPVHLWCRPNHPAGTTVVRQLLNWRSTRPTQQAVAPSVRRTSLGCDSTAAQGAVVFFKGTYCSHFMITSLSFTRPLWAFHSLYICAHRNT